MVTQTMGKSEYILGHQRTTINIRSRITALNKRKQYESSGCLKSTANIGHYCLQDMFTFYSLDYDKTQDLPFMEVRRSSSGYAVTAGGASHVPDRRRRRHRAVDGHRRRMVVIPFETGLAYQTGTGESRLGAKHRLTATGHGTVSERLAVLARVIRYVLFGVRAARRPRID